MSRLFLPTGKEYRQVAPASEIEHKFAKQAITQGHLLSIKGTFSVGASAPTGVPVEQLARMIANVEVKDSNGITYWDLTGVALSAMIKKTFGTSAARINLATSGTNAEFELNLPIEYGLPRGPNSYDTGMNTYTKDATLNIIMADWEKDGVLWAANNDFVIDSDSVTVDILPRHFDADAGSTARNSPAELMMTTLIEKNLTITQTNDDFEFETDKGRRFSEFHMIGIQKTVSSGLEIGSYGTFDMEQYLKIHEKDLSGRNSHKVKVRQARRFMTELNRQFGTDTTTGHVVLSLVDENRMRQARISTTAKPLMLYMPVVGPASGYQHSIKVLQSGIMNQE